MAKQETKNNTAANGRFSPLRAVADKKGKDASGGKKNTRRILGVQMSEKLFPLFIVLVLLVACGVGFGLNLLRKALYTENERLVLREIRFEGTTYYSCKREHGHVSIEDVLESAGIHVKQGDGDEKKAANLLTLDSQQVYEALKKNSLLNHVVIRKILPGTLEISAREHHPLAQLVVEKAGNAWDRHVLAFYKDTPQLNKIILLPPTLDLFNETKNTYEKWKYALWPTPFDKKQATNLPLLYDFLPAGTDKKTGDILGDKPLMAAVMLLNMLDIDEDRRLFTVMQIKQEDKKTLLMLVKPRKDSKRLAGITYIRIAVDNITDGFHDRLYKAILDENASLPIASIDVTGKDIILSPKKFKNI